MVGRSHLLEMAATERHACNAFRGRIVILGSPGLRSHRALKVARAPVVAFCLLLGAIVFASAAALADAWPEVSAQSALVVDAETGQVLFEKAPDTKSFPASLTKVLTALILLESGQQTQWVAAPRQLPRFSGSTIDLKPGDALSVPDLAKAIIIASANDAAFLAARQLAGSEEAFADMMNRKAAALGLKNSHFVNPNGLHDPDHYSTARELTLVARAALQNEQFRRLVATQRDSITVVSNQVPRQITLESHNGLLGNYPGCDGVKSGFTLQAGHCLVASATRDGWQVIATVLKSEDAERDASSLLDYAFQSMRCLMVAEAGKLLTSFAVSGGTGKEVAAVPAEDLRLVVGKDASISVESFPIASPLRAPLKAGQEVGSLLARVGGNQVSAVSLLASRDVPRARLPLILKDPRFPLAIVLLVLAILLGLWAFRKSLPRR